MAIKTAIDGDSSDNSARAPRRAGLVLASDDIRPGMFVMATRGPIWTAMDGVGERFVGQDRSLNGAPLLVRSVARPYVAVVCGLLALESGPHGMAIDWPKYGGRPKPFVLDLREFEFMRVGKRFVRALAMKADPILEAWDQAHKFPYGRHA